MDVKDLRTEAASGDRNNDGNTKYPQGGGALPCHRNKAYQDIGSNSLGKVDAATTRPCAVIGPDRVVPPPASTDAYLKKGPTEPWLGPENTYRRPPEYPHKLLDFQHPTRNISPRQTFQENMQRIMVPPTYSSLKIKEDHNFSGDPNITQMRNKLNVPTDPNSKYCDVPYNMNPLLNEQKTVRSSDISASNMNSVLTRSAPHVWPPTSANVRPSKPYPQDLCQYPEYPSCAGPRPMVMPRSHRTVHEEPGPVYSDPYYHDGNIRYKPYPSVKERYPQARYEYIGNYPNPFHPPPPFPTHKYDLQKPMHPHPYPGYSQMPIKYLDSRMADPIMNGYQRSLNPQANYNNMAYRNQVIHPPYGPVPSNCLQTNKFYPYPPDASKSMLSSKLPYADANGKIYSEYENRPKNFPMCEGFYVNDITRTHHMKATGLPTGYLPNIHSMPTHPYYRKEPMKGYEYNPHFRNIDPSMNINGNPVPRFTTQFSPNSIAISPSDSNASNDTNHTQGTSHEDFGYVSQSSTTSVRSLDSALNRIPHEYRRYEHRYSPIVKPSLNKIDHNSNGSKDKKEIDVRQFLQMWNEGEEEVGDIAKEVMIKTVPNNIIDNANSNKFDTSSQEQLYVLGLVNVPSEELAKYEHIQKVSKLPENIKGYNNIELLHQFEEVIESSNLNNYTAKHPTSYDFHASFKGTMPMHGISIPSRPLSPLDVEAKISQSVIHKDVGCNFEIKPCSPKMLNVEIAAPVQLVMNERIIEKVSNPLIDQSPTHGQKENRDDYNVVKCQDRISTHDNSKIASCKLINSQYSHSDTLDPTKTNYSIQDLESNSGVCLASLPRLDNDIELSFPEVNQQFINANKVDSVITPTPMKDLPPLDLEQCDNTDRQLLATDVNNTTSAKLSEKDFSKLSKYRKLKRKSSDPPTSETSVQALRTDSVIIKNPENIKSLDKNQESPEICANKKSSTKIKCNEAQEDPINLSVNTENRHNSSFTSEVKKNNSSYNQEVDIAIDFSANATENKEIHAFDPKGRNTKEEYKQQDNLLAAEDEKLCPEKSNLFSDDDSIRSILEGENNTSEVFDHMEVNKNSTLLHSEIPGNTKKKRKRSSNAKNKHNEIMSEDYETTTSKSINESQMQQVQLSAYSTPDTEDSINVKMRELFGELSGAETEPSSIGPREYLDGSGLATISSDDDMLPTKMFALHEGILKDQLKQVQNPIKIGHDDKNQDKATPNISDTTKILSIPGSPHDILETKHKKSIFDINDASFESLTKNVIETQNLLDSPSCHTNAENIVTTNCYSVTDTFRISKELLSPWIQKLMIHTEGCVNVAEHNLVNDDNLKCLLPRQSSLEDNFVNNTLIDNLSPTIMYKTGTKLKEMESENEISEIKECPILKEKSLHKNNEQQNIDLESISVTYPKLSSREDDGSFVTLDDSKNLDSPLLETCLSSENEEISLHPAQAPASQVIETICKPEGDVLTSEVIISATTEDSIPINACDNIASSPKSEIFVNLTDGFRNCKENSNDFKSRNPICNATKDTEDHSDTSCEELLPNPQSNLNSGSNKTNVNNEAHLDKSDLTYSSSAGTASSTNLKIIDICECGNGIDGDTLKNLEVPSELVINPTVLANDTRSYSHETASKNYSAIESRKSKGIISKNELVQTKAAIPCEDSVNKNIDENETVILKSINNLQNSTNRDENEDQNEMSRNFVETKADSQEADGFHHDIEKIYILNKVSETPTVTVSPHMIETNDHNDSLRNDFLSPSSEVIIEEYNNKDDSVSEIDIEDSGIVVDNGHNVFESIQKESLCQELANFTTSSKSKDLIGNSQHPQNYSTKKRQTLKRSLSDTALHEIRGDEIENHTFLRPTKIKKTILNNEHETRLFAENICEVLRNHRRNSVSSMQNEENVSFCILIDNNCIITEECDESDKICFSEVPEDCIACVQEEHSNEDDSTGEIIQFQKDTDCCDCPSVLDNNFEQEEERSTEPWLEDVACVETVVSDDIAENIVISASVSPRNFGSEGEFEDVENVTEAYVIDHADNGEQISNVDAYYVDPLYSTVQKTLNTTESHFIQDFSERYDTVSLQDILLGSTIPEEAARNSIGFECTSPMSMSSPSTRGNSPSNMESVELANYDDCDTESATLRTGSPFTEVYDEKDDAEILYAPKVNTINSCESSIDDVFSSKKSEDNSKCTISSSPEVSSTTSEEKSTGILLKITNYTGSRVPQVTDICPINSICCKYTEKKDYLSSNSKQYLNSNLSTRTLITKAAQKYIPPLKESIPDLKVKLPLPPQSLIKLKQMKLSKEIVKLHQDKTIALNTFKQDGKKSKPKFEDVLKSIDEIHYQKHKEKSKKVRKSIPKVVIKKNENGSHYASTSFKDNHNPDLTGRKWQPWVFLERNHFIDKMALKKKTTAIFNHRKNCYVLAEKFYKYRSVSSTKFVISQPNLDESSSGLKYTIRLKHQY